MPSIDHGESGPGRAVGGDHEARRRCHRGEDGGAVPGYDLN